MQRSLDGAESRFVEEQHIRNVLTGAWVDLFDEDGNKLTGIRARVGAVGPGTGEREIGGDLIEMQPGSAFPLHVHDGAHVLFIISGRGLVRIDGNDHELVAGDTVFVPAQYPHGVRTYEDDSAPLIFLAIGHPHKHVTARDRMKLLQEPA